MKKVFDLRKSNIDNPYLMEMYQKATLSKNTDIGLLGEFGLYGSEEWWENIAKGNIRSLIVEGIITDLFVEGQDSSENTFKVTLDNGDIISEAIMVNNPSDKKLFKKGKLVSIKYIFDKRKAPNDMGLPDYSDIVTEILISS